MKFLFQTLAHCPLWLLHSLGWCLGWLTWLLSPTYRRRFLDNARQAGYRFGQVMGAVGHSGKMAAETPRLWMGNTPPSYRWDDPQECIAQAYAAGRGVVFLTPHMGCFEIAPQALARDWGAQRGPIAVLYRPSRQPWLAQLMLSARNREHVHAVPTTLTGVRELIKALRQGHAVGLLPDQVPPEGLGIWSPFFDKPAYTMTLSVRLAQQTGARIVLAWGERLSWGRGFIIHIHPMPVDLPQDMEQAVACINTCMQDIIRQCPQQYLWGYARYKTPRAQAAPQSDTPASDHRAP